jgi:hypothetical protein
MLFTARQIHVLDIIGRIVHCSRHHWPKVWPVQIDFCNNLQVQKSESSKKGSESSKLEKNCKSWPGLPDGIPIFKPEIQFWVNFGCCCNGRCSYILYPFGICYVNLEYFMAIWYISW